MKQSRAPQCSHDPVSVDDIRAAQRRIDPFIHRTPIAHSELLDELAGCSVYFKCENLQKVGAFKARGALNAVRGLPRHCAAAGVATHSSGNHGAALAMAAATRDMPARIVMPSTAPAVKKAAVRGYGGIVVECEPTLPAREQTLHEVVAEHHSHVVHPYDDPRIVAGQGTVGLELLDQLDNFDTVLVPVGGGGLLGGVAIAIKTLRPAVQVIAVEPAGADDAFRSWRLGRRVPQENPRTIADGLLTSLGALNFAIIRDYVDDIITVTDDSIIRAMQLQWTRTKLLVEPSGAVPFAGILENPAHFRGRIVACIISGGNVDLEKLPW